MNANELRESLNSLYADIENVGLCVYAVLRDSSVPAPLKLDIEASAIDDLKLLFFQSLKDSLSDDRDLTVLKLSSADERANAVYEYDLEVPPALSAMSLVTWRDDLPLLDLNHETLGSIKALLIEMGTNASQVVLYKTMAPVNIFGRASFFLKRSASRLEKLEDEFLRVSAGFQMLRIDDTLLVLDLAALERNFGFHDIIKREAQAGIQAIVASGIVANPEVLSGRLEDIAFARRLTKIAKASPVLMRGVPIREIAQFCQTFPSLAGRIRVNQSGDQILLDTNVSQDLFIKVMMDDFLTSELTRLHYESLAKDGMDATAGEAP